MMEIDMARGARKIVEECLDVRPGEEVLIVTDTGRDFSIATCLASAVSALGANYSVMITRPLDRAGQEPAPSVVGAMRSADVVIAPTTRTIFHTKAVREATEKGRTRFYSLSEFKPELLISGFIEADFAKQKPLVEALAAKMDEGKTIKITAPGGTDFTGRIEGRKSVPESGICVNPGERMGASIEVYIAPLEDSVEGVFVCDASCSMVGLVHEPIRIRFHHGRAVEIDGGAEAKRLREILDSVGTPEAYNIGEIAFGLNPSARLRGNIIEDESKYGTGHVALGNNEGFGGKVTAPIHVDMVYWKPSVWIDGEQVFRDGELLVNGA